MGYYVSLTDSNAYIPADKLDEAYKLLCDLNQRNDLKTGGSGGYAFGRTPEGETPIDGPHDKVWFAWMPWNYPEVYTNAAEVLEAVGFEVVYDADGSLGFQSYENKTGCEQTFIEALTPVLASTDGENPYFVWQGEDGLYWRQRVEDGEMVVQEAIISWGTPK
jgi:hypothetical protein